MVSTELQSGDSLLYSAIHPDHTDCESHSLRPDRRVGKHPGGLAKKSKTFALSIRRCPSPELKPQLLARRSSASSGPTSVRGRQLGLPNRAGRRSFEETFPRVGVLPE